jgi:hypothetical protein
VAPIICPHNTGLSIAASIHSIAFRARSVGQHGRIEPQNLLAIGQRELNPCDRNSLPFLGGVLQKKNGLAEDNAEEERANRWGA